ncbi:MAG: thioredoxin family protein [Gammaproteobacteria bacterium]|nr:thioredoxin family protein [Gammaproteobacteria bacterium]
MARTPSTMLPLGTAAPGFTLPEPSTGRTVSLTDFAGRPLVVIFWCNHCPFVKHIAARVGELADRYLPRDVAFVAISSNDVAYKAEDGVDQMPTFIEQYGIHFPYLYDESQQIAKAYRAACTPDFYLFDADHKLAYRGQFDDSRPGNDAPVTGADLEDAIKALLANLPVPEGQKASLGCNIKWKPGNEPDYYG